MNNTTSGKEPEMHPSIRASDADRQHVVQALHEHTAAGRLSLDEFTDRVDAAHRATTHGELAAITADLPAEPPTRRGGAGGLLLVAAVVAVLVLTLLLGVAGLAGWSHMSTMTAAMSTMGRCH
jgi:ferric-dicitrate binding protein FerR (iron transport regulator)